MQIPPCRRPTGTRRHGRSLSAGDAHGQTPSICLALGSRAASALPGNDYDSPLDPARAREWLGRSLDRHRLHPGSPTGAGARLEMEPWARITEAVVFDGRERRRVKARTDAGVRLRLDGIPLSGPRTRIRAVFGTDETPFSDRPGTADPGPAPRQLLKLPAWR